MSFLTPNLGLTVPSVGGDVGPAYANEINGDFGIIDNALGSVAQINVGGTANVTATTAQAQNLIQNLTGVLGANILYKLPARGGFWAIQNNTSGNFTLGVGVTGGSNTINVPQGSSVWIWSDGAAVRNAAPPQQPQVISGWVQTSSVTLSNAPNLAAVLSSSYRRYRLTMQGVSSNSAGTSISLGMSTDGGVTFAQSFTGMWSLFSFNNGPVNTGQQGFITPFPLNSPGSLRGDGVAGLDLVAEIYPGGINQRGFARCFSIADSGTAGIFSFRVEGWSTINGLVNYLNIAPSQGALMSGTAILEGFP